MKNKNNLEGLQTILFDTLRGLKDNSIPPENARSINETAQTIINSVKLQIDHARLTGDKSCSNFMSQIQDSETKDLEDKPASYIHKIGQRHV